MAHTYRDQTLAFAGIWQATFLVQQIARKGNINPDDFTTSIQTLFETDPKTTEAVYGSVSGVETGLKVILEQFGSKTASRDMELTKYMINIMQLERKLEKKPEILNEISSRLEVAKSQAEHFSTTHENVLASIAGVYSSTSSTQQPRIIIQGDQGYLGNPSNADKVR